MATKKLQILGAFGGNSNIYVQDEEPIGAQENAIWIDMDDEDGDASGAPVNIKNCVVAQDAEPEDTSLLWIDTDDNTGNESVDMSNYALKSDIPSIDGLASEEYVNNAINSALGVIENGSY